MAFRDEGETSRTMSSVGRMEPDQAARDKEFAAAKGGDPAARWRALEACRDYLRLVVRRGRLSDAAGLQATSDLVQGTFVERLAPVFEIPRPVAGPAPRLAQGDPDPCVAQRPAAAGPSAPRFLADGGGPRRVESIAQPDRSAEVLGGGTGSGARGTVRAPPHGHPPAALGTLVVRRDRHQDGTLGRRRADAVWTGAGEAPRIHEARP